MRKKTASLRFNGNLIAFAKNNINSNGVIIVRQFSSVIKAFWVNLI